MGKHEDILEAIDKQGPSHPTQMAKVIGSDSFTATVLLGELIELGKIKKTFKKVGGTSLFYLPKQEEEARRRVINSLDILEKKILERVKQEGFVFYDELDAQSRYIINELKDILIPLKATINNEPRVIWKHYKTDNREIEKKVFSKRPAKSEKEPPKPAEKKIDKAEEANDFQSIGMKVIATEKTKKQKTLVLETLGALKQKYFAIEIKKSRINDKDLSMIYTEIMSRKMPAVVITNASFTKKAKNFLNKELKDLIKVIKR